MVVLFFNRILDIWCDGIRCAEHTAAAIVS